MGKRQERFLNLEVHEAGAEDHRQSGMDEPKATQSLLPGDPRHVHVQDHKVGRRPRLQPSQALEPALGHLHAMPQAGQHSGHPSPFKTALAFAEELRSRPNAVRVEPGPRHWEIFTKLCAKGDARGNLVPDAWLASLAVESGCELVTTDRDFARFP